MTVNRNKNIGNEQDQIVIFGAGPAGLTAGFELVRNSQSVLILESDKPVITLEALKSHASSLTESKKEVFNDFILYLQMTELDNKLFN